MLRIYLDQAKWIDLLKCRAGRADGKKFQEVYDLARHAVERGLASFVLSTAHYYETQARSNPRSRRELGATIADFSRFHAIAPTRVVVPAEIQQALTGRPLTSQMNLFGVGFNHAFHTDADLGSPDPSKLADTPFGQHAELRAAYRWWAELCVLAAPPPSNGAEQRMLEVARTIRDGAQTFVDTQDTIGGYVASNRLRDRLDEVAISTELEDIWEPLIAGCRERGVDVRDRIATIDSARALLQALPSRWVMSELRRVRLRNPQQLWKKNDLNDLLALSIAVPYCDVVVTERQWAVRVNELGLAQQYGTTVLHDLTDLTGVLVAKSVFTS
ncbi:hypothetical protein [Nocardia sp. NPDC058114]|uniref:hypothetical protein n=1 Tax=Nocardia sp. NPDC058114 TaxID=3346346 RepID=UPI0036DA4A30